MKTALQAQNNTPDSANSAQTSGAFAPTSELGTETQQEEVPDLQCQWEQATTYGHSFSSFPIQPALVMGQPGDPYEREADQLAAQAVAMGPNSGSTSTVQRKVEPTLQRDVDVADAAPPPALEALANAAPTSETAPPEAGDEETAESAPAQPANTVAETASNNANDLETKIQQAMATGGSPLPVSIQVMLTERLGMDNPEDIRIHDDSTAHQLCEQLHARAFTTQNHIFFASGQYKPDTPEGQELIFHESVHTMQQGAINSRESTPVAGEAQTPAGADSTSVGEVAAEATEAAFQSPDTTSQASDVPTTVQQKAVDGMIQREEKEEMSEEEKERKKEEIAGEARKNEGEDAKKQVEGSGVEKSEEEKADEAESEEEGKGGTVVPEPAPTAIAAPKSGPGFIPDEDEFDPESYEDLTLENGNQVLTNLGFEGSGISEQFYFQAVRQEAFQSLGDLMNQQDPPGVELPEKRDLPFTPYEPPPWLGGTGGSTTDFLIRDLALGGIPSKSIEIFNTFGGIANETNPFGVMASLMEGFIKITELVTAILTTITLVLSIVAAILYAVGTALMAFFGAGAPLIAFAAKLTALCTKLGVISAKLAAVRLIVMRPIAMLLRGLDLAFSWAMGASAEELQAKQNALIGQAVGMVTDGIEVLLAPAGATKVGDAMKKGLGSAGKFVKKGASAVGSKIKAGATKAFNKVKGLVPAGGGSSSGVLAKLKNFGSKASNKIKSFLPKSNGPGFTDKVKAKFGTFKNFVKEKGTVIKDVAADKMDSAKQVLNFEHYSGKFGKVDVVVKGKDIVETGASKSLAAVGKPLGKSAAHEAQEALTDKGVETAGEAVEEELTSDSEDESDEETSLEELQQSLAERFDGRQEQYEEAVNALPPIPYDTLDRVDQSAAEIALTTIEQEEMEDLKGYTQEEIALRQASSMSIYEAQTSAAQNQVALEQSNYMAEQQIAYAEAFQEQNKQLNETSNQSKSHMGHLGSMIKPLQPGIQSGAKRAAEEGESDPSLQQGGKAEETFNQGPGHADSTIQVGNQGISGAQSTANKSQQMISRGESAIADTQQFQELANQRQEQNAEEISVLSDAAQEIEMQQQEAEDQQSTAHDERTAALEQALTWANESRAIIDGFLMGTLNSQEEAKVEAELLDEDEDGEQQAPEEAIADFDALAEAIAAELRAEREAATASA